MATAWTGHPYGAQWLMYKAIGIFKDQAQVDATKAKVAGTKPGDVIFERCFGRWTNYQRRPYFG
jgi:hypothetical protein